MASSMGSSASLSESTRRRCHCRQEARIFTSWTATNTGRRFFGCGQYGSSGACGYFAWYDPPLTPRGMKLISGMLKKCSKLEDEVRMHQIREKLYRRFILILGIIILATVMYMYMLKSRKA